MTRALKYKQPYADDLRFAAAKDRIAPLVDSYDRFERELRWYIETLTDEQLEVVSAEGNLFSTTNCGWDEYRVAHWLAAEARQEQRHRTAKAATA